MCSGERDQRVKAMGAHAPQSDGHPAAARDEPAVEEMVMFLERDQLVADRRHPRGPAALSRSAKVGLWSLRIFAFIVGAMVIYTFLAQL